MTPTKTVNRLVDLGPAVLRPNTKTPNHCVLATAVGIQALAAFGIDAKPLSVHVSVANKAWLDGAAAVPEGGSPDWEAMRAAGAWLIETGDEADPQTGTWDATGWHGHLVIHVPDVNGGGLVDLTLGAMARPAKNIHLPAAASFRWLPPRTVYNMVNGAQLSFKERPGDTSYIGARDWTEEHVDLVNGLVRAMRKGRL